MKQILTLSLAVLSFYWSRAQAPAPPVANAATGVTSSTFTINWNTSSGATAYFVDVSISNTFASFVSGYNNQSTTSFTGNPNGSIVVYSGFTSGTTYYYRLRASNASGTSASSNIITVVLKPGTPGPLAASGITSNSLTANWNAANGATQYDVQYSTSNAFSTYSTVSTSATNIQITGLSPATTYYYRVAASNASGSSSFSSSITTGTAPTQPTALAATSITNSSFLVNFSSVTGATAYYLDISTSPTFTSFVSGYNNANTNTFTGNWQSQSSVSTNFTSGTTYYYRLRAANANGTSSSSNTITLSTLMIPPVALAGSDFTTSSFQANWNAAIGATQYTVQYSTSNTFTTSTSVNTTGTSKVISGLTAGTTYYYRVLASNGSISTGYSSIIMTGTTLPAPVATPATSVSSGSFMANWATLAGATAYFLDVSTTNTFATFVSGYENANTNTFTGSWNSTVAIYSSLNAGMTYYYRLRASNAYGTSASSNPITVTLNVVAPTALAGTNNTPSSFQANWNASGGATQYTVQYSTSNTFSPASTVTTSGTNIVISALAPATTYYYRISATNGTSTSAYSTSITTGTTPNVPTANAATNVTTSSLLVNWTPVSGASAYYLDISTSPTFASFVNGYNNANSNMFTGTWQNQVSVYANISSGTTYYYRIRSANAYGSSPSSNVITFYTINVPPTLLPTTNILPNSMTLNWNGVQGADGYRLDVATNNTFTNWIPNHQDKLVTGTSYNLTGLLPNLTYYYRVRAVNSYVTSSSSTISSQTTPLPPPDPVNISQVTGTSFKINWTSVSSAMSYLIDVSKNDDFSTYDWHDEYRPAATLTSTKTGLLPATTYYVRIRTQYTFPGPYSTVVSAKTGPAAPVLTSDNNGILNLGNQVKLFVQTVLPEYVSYEWSLNGSVQATTSQPSLSVSVAGSYTVRALSPWGAYSDESTALVVSSGLSGVNRNYIITNVPQVQYTSPAQLTAGDGTTISQKIQYFDALGRLSQEVQTQNTPDRSDLVTPHHYNSIGLESKVYLPFVSGSNGTFKEDAIGVTSGYTNSPQYQFYHAPATGMTGDEIPFAEIEFETSPLHRPLKQYGPGLAWSAAQNNKFSETRYFPNTHGTGSSLISEKIIAWEIDAAGMPVRAIQRSGYVLQYGYYDNNQLYVTESRNENGNSVREYRDKYDHLILRKVQVVAGSTNLNSATEWALTYYIYDQRNNLRIVLQPELIRTVQASDSYAITAADLDNYAFQYTYDSRKRMTIKKVPGAGPVYQVYDDRDRLILTQDENQRATATKYWTFYKYDWLNREVMTGIKDTTGALTPDLMQQGVAQHYAKSWARYSEEYVGNASRSVHGYTNTAYPVTTGLTNSVDPDRYMSVNYFDGYDFKALWGGTDYNYVNEALSASVYTTPVKENEIVRGQATGGKIKVLDGGIAGGTSWLRVVNYYDARLRPVQVVSDNYKGGIDRKTTLLDFTGRTIKSLTRHNQQDVSWTGVVGATVIGNKLVRTEPGNTWGAAGAVSTQELPAGQDGWIEVTVDDLLTRKSIGLSADNPDSDEATIDFSFQMDNASLAIRENGTPVATYTNVLSKGDVLRIERSGNTIIYKRNGTQLTFTNAGASPKLLVDAALYTTAGQWVNARTSFGQAGHVISRSIGYDHAGRITKVWHKFDSEPEVLLIENKYNALGQLITKGLHNITGNAADTKQWVDYQYNIRGWITSINDSELTSQPGDLFGMNIGYEQSLGMEATPMFNGNISAIKWSNNLALGAVKENAYTFTYDASDQLLASSFSECSSGTWDVLANNGFAENLQYNLNGNITRIWRNDRRANDWMDDLTLEYGSGNTKSNRLLKVSDAGDMEIGFKDNGSASDDYNYDGNGNLTVDNNKSLLTPVAFNVINRPEVITRGASTLRNIYDADGIKLTQVISGSGPQKQTDYVGEFQYLNDELQTVAHEEGRIVAGKQEKLLMLSGDGTGGVTPTTGITLANEKLNNQEYLKVTASAGSSLSGRGLFPVGGSFTVHGGERYLFRIRGYSGTEPVALQVRINGINLVWPGMQLMSSVNNEAWSESYITIPVSYTTAALQVGVLWNSSATTAQTFYINDIELVRLDAQQPEYQYDLKDHLGSSRVTFTSKPETNSVKATLEPEFENNEYPEFINYGEAVKINSALFNNTPNTTTHYATRLSGGNTQEIYGLARSMSVMPGDKFNIEVFAKYVDPVAGNWSADLATLMGLIAEHSSGVFLDEGLPGSLGNGTFPYLGLLARDNDMGTGPKAYLNYILFDRNFKYVTGGFDRLTTVAKESGALGTPTGVAHQRLAFDNLVIKQPGYLYVYLSNENETPVEVYFDDLKIEHIKSPVVQQNDYYPFGMTRTFDQRENAVLNTSQYTSKEQIDELNLEWYDYVARQYDPQTGRFLAVDPMAEFSRRWSPYVYGYNNPLRFVDPDGMLSEEVLTIENFNTVDLHQDADGVQMVTAQLLRVTTSRVIDDNGNVFLKRVTMTAEATNVIRVHSVDGKNVWKVEEGEVKVKTITTILDKNGGKVSETTSKETLTQDQFIHKYDRDGSNSFHDLKQASEKIAKWSTDNNSKVMPKFHDWMDDGHYLAGIVGTLGFETVGAETVLKPYFDYIESARERSSINYVTYHGVWSKDNPTRIRLYYYSNQTTGQHYDNYYTFGWPKQQTKP